MALHQRRFKLEIIKQIFLKVVCHWTKLPREVVESLESFMSHLDVALGDMV